MMRLRTFGVVAGGVLIGGLCFSLGRYAPSVIPGRVGALSGIGAQLSRNPSPSPQGQALAGKSPVRTSPNPLIPERILSQGNGRELFSLLFEGRLLKTRGFAFLPLIRQRFSSPYPTNERSHEKERVARMGILKAMFLDLPPSLAPKQKEELLSFYESLLAHEEFLVRRQAVRNLAAWMSRVPEARRRRMLAAVDARTLASASRSEAEILNEAFSQ